MATSQPPFTLANQRTPSHIGVLRLAVTTGVAAGLVFALCWLGTFFAFSSPTHAYISLFTNADMRSGRALAEGTLWSLLFGALVAAAFALIYNATALLTRR